MKKFLPHIIILILIAAIFSCLYFPNHSFGARGDDSPGYIFLAAKLFNNQPLIYQDQLIKEGIKHFNNIKDANFLVPSHNKILNQEGWTASKYPIGFSILLFLFAKIFNNFDKIYSLVPALAVLNLVLIYLLTCIIFKKSKYSWLIAILSVLFLGLSKDYWQLAIIQPMREIPFIFFLLLAFIFAILGLRKNKYFLIFSGLSLGYALNIRETGIIFIIPFLILFFLLYDKNISRKDNFLKICKNFLFFIIPLVIIFSLTLIYSQLISLHSESNLALPNIKHVKSFSISHLFLSENRYRHEPGGLAAYWQVFNNITYLQLFLLFIFFGIIKFYKNNKIIFFSFTAIILSYYLLFSLWINPYPRYILPTYPFIIIILSLGIIYLFQYTTKNFPKYNKFLVFIIIITCLINCFPIYENIRNYIKGDFDTDRSINKQDLENLKFLKNHLTQNSILIFSGEGKNGLPETFEAETKIRSIKTPIIKTSQAPWPKIVDFFNQQLKDKNYYIWIDTSSSSENNEFFSKNFDLQKIISQNYSFKDNVDIYKLNPKT